MRPDVFGPNAQRLVVVGADQVRLALLPAVDRPVLMPQDGMPVLGRLAGEFGQGGGFRVQVAKGFQRQRDPGHLADEAAPNPSGTDDGLSADAAAIGANRNHSPVCYVDAGYVGVPIKLRGLGGLRVVGECRGQLPSPRNAVAGRI